MCGIVGYLGKKEPVPLIIDSLKQLEYRGYDSAGIAYVGDDKLLHVYKSQGKLVNLQNILPEVSQQPHSRKDELLNIGIGHIRWATHGIPDDINAHPHLSTNKEVAIVHNGIIENFYDLRHELQQDGYEFTSQTDTECVAQLLEKIHKEEDDYLQVILKTVNKLKGAYALSVIFQENSQTLYAVRNQAPLLIGMGKGEYVVASDVVAFAQHIDEVIYLKDKQIAEVTSNGVRIFDTDGNEIEPVVEKLMTGPLTVDKKGYKHFMLKEIYEQPDVIRNSLSSRLISSQQPIRLLSRDEDEKGVVADLLKTTNRILIIGCGTSFNAGMVGKYFIEDVVQVPVDVESAGEFRYRKPVLDENTMVVAVSQSGETADTLAAIRLAKEKNAKILTITNREDSTIARESDLVLPVRAGVEVSVCATKSFTAQVVVLYLLGLRMAEDRNTLHPEQLEHLKEELVRMPTKVEALLSNTDDIQAVARKYGEHRDMLFIGRGINYPVSLEGALKLKEISYIHAEGYSGSELKHGPIAMLDSNMPVVAVLTPGIVLEKMISNCQEAKARDALMIAFTSADISPEVKDTFNDIVTMPATDELLSPLLTAIPLQLLSYYIAEYLGKDVDQPRNLAKSVTVE